MLVKEGEFLKNNWQRGKRNQEWISQVLIVKIVTSILSHLYPT